MGRPRHILVVDDETDILEMLDILLEVEGFEVKTATSGLAALDVLSKQSFDAVLLDVVMRPTDGWETARQIRQRFPGLAVYFVTAHVDERNYAKAQENGLIQGRLYKPFDIDDIKHILASAQPN